MQDPRRPASIVITWRPDPGFPQLQARFDLHRNEDGHVSLEGPTRMLPADVARLVAAVTHALSSTP